MMMQHRHVEPVVIGRDRHIAEVVDLIKNANDGQGSFIVIEGGPGAGKTTLIQAFDGHCKQDAALADARFLIGTCSQGTRYLDPYQPFVDILSGLLNKERGGRDVLQRLRSIVTATGPDLVPMIPVVGAPLIAGVMPVSIMTGLGLGIGDDRRSATSVAISAQIETVFLEAAIEFAPLILVIDDAQWIDESSRHVLKRLVRDIDRKRIVVILALRPEEAVEHRPLTEMRADIRRSQTVEIALADLDADAMLEQRLRMLDDADRELLRLASVQGERFRPPLLAQMIGTDEPAVLRRIQHLIDEYGLISVGPGDVWSSDQPEVYQFAPTMLREVLYHQIHTHHRPPLHAAIRSR
jgi:predicted ATPase